MTNQLSSRNSSVGQNKKEPCRCTSFFRSSKWNIVLVIASTLISLIFSEMTLRLLDKYVLTSFLLIKKDSILMESAAPSQIAIDYAKEETYLPEIDPEWFSMSLPKLSVPKSEDIVLPFIEAGKKSFRLRMSSNHFWDELRNMSLLLNSSRIWNKNFIKNSFINGNDYFKDFEDDLLVFTPATDNEYPRYRLIPNSQIGGFRINGLGYRGADVSIEKSPRTIRIVFLGASTTLHQMKDPFSYPECVEMWLNTWSEKTGLDIRFECINAGCGGYISTDMAALVEADIQHLDPDFVLYYEGSNQFNPQSMIRLKNPDPCIDSPPADSFYIRFLKGGGYYSAFFKRLYRLSIHASRNLSHEISKPVYDIIQPTNINWESPNPDNPDLPFNLPTIIHDLDAINLYTKKSGGEFALLSFIWLSKDGIILDPLRHAGIHYYLNHRYWPVRYREIRNFADFQNRVFSRYASIRNIPFLDIASDFPRDPDLFIDGIHMTPSGIRLRAWTVFQHLLPLIKEKIKKQSLTHSTETGTHNFPPQRKIERVSYTLESLFALTGDPIAINLENFKPNNPNCELKLRNHRKKVRIEVQTPKNKNSYAAETILPNIESTRSSLWIEIKASIQEGRVSLGILPRERDRWIVNRIVERKNNFIYLYIDQPSDDMVFMVTNASLRGDVPSKVIIEAISILSE